jgi:hypothetical protein
MRFVAAVCFVVLAACSDTPVSPNALRSQAVHFDSLASIEAAKPNPGQRLVRLAVIANALAHGAVPGIVSMTIAGVPKRVEIVGVETVYKLDVGKDEHVLAAGWVDPAADTMIAVTGIETADGFIDQAVGLYVGDSGEGTQAYPPSFSYVQTNTDAQCTNYPVVNLLVGPNPPCHLEHAALSFDVVPATFDGSPQLLPVGAAIVSPEVTFGLAQLMPTGPGLLARYGL